MNTAKDHYDRQLAAVYSWMAGNSAAAIDRNRDLFHQFQIDRPQQGLAIDLGAGCGDRWVLNASSYPKLRIDRNWACEELTTAGLAVTHNETIDGMVYIVAEKL
jgi:hypothetical protein